MKTWMLKSVCLSILLMFAVRAIADTPSTTVLVNQSVNIESLTPAQLRMIFAGRTQFWPDGSRIRVFVLPNENPEHQTFCRSLLNIYPYQLERIWHRVVYSGQGNAPTVIDTPQALAEQIASTPGAIGYGPTSKGYMENTKAITVGAQP